MQASISVMNENNNNKTISQASEAAGVTQSSTPVTPPTQINNATTSPVQSIYSRNEPTQTVDNGFVHRARKFLSRRSVIIALVASVLLILSIVTLLIFINQNQPKQSKSTDPQNEPLSLESIDNATLKLLSDNLTSGATQQALTIRPNVVFNRNATVEGSLTASSIQTPRLGVIGPAVISGQLEAGSGRFGGDVSVTGRTNITGALDVGAASTIAGGLTVRGPISASSLNVGELSVASLAVAGDLRFSGHVISGAKGITAATGVAAGSVSVDGNDTAGTVIINSKSSAPTSGQLARVIFKKARATLPKVLITPVGNDSAQLNFYVERTSTFFVIGTANSTAPDTQYVFDYFVIE